jgi:uncharacterized membrane protein YbhN (UPF0104 family)
MSKRLGTLALLAALAVALGASAPGLGDLIARIRNISLIWLLMAVALKLASELSFVVVFRLFFDRLPARLARPLAWTELASGVLLPGGGVSGLAIGGWLIHMAGAPKRWIVRRSGGLYFLTAAINAAALVIAGVVLFAGAAGPNDFARIAPPTLIAVALTFLLAWLPSALRSRPNAPRALRIVGIGVRDAQRTTFTRRPSWRLVGALGYVGFDIAVLWVALRAFGHPPALATLVLAYNVGHLAKLVPIPGGIGAFDAGMTGALALYGVSPAHAAAAVLVYHAIALWVPGVGGLLAYLRLRPRLVRPAAGAANGPLIQGPTPVAEGGTP